MAKFVIINACYKPNTALMNRLLSFLSAFDNSRLQAEVVFVYPDKHLSRLDIEYKNISVRYLWDRTPTFRNKYLKYLKSFIDIYLYSRELSPDDKVLYIEGGVYLPILIKTPAKIYCECTEHPYVITFAPSFLRGPFLKACPKLRGLFVISTALKTYFESIGVNNVVVVNMTVDPDRFINLEKQQMPHPYIAYCGTVGNNKDGVDNLIRAFAIVKRKYPDYRLMIMGSYASKKDASGNLNLITQLGLSDDIIFAGCISAADMPQRLKDAEIVALARPDNLQNQCGFPTKLGEYLLSGNPVVCTSVGDIPLFLKNRESALISEPGDIEAFAKNLLWVIENKATAMLIGKNGRRVALESFNNEIECAKIQRAIFG